MAIRALKLDTNVSHVSKFDPAGDTDDATRFTLGALDSRVSGFIRDKATKIVVDPKNPMENIETSVNASDVNFLTVQFGLKGWTNFKDDKGNDVAYRQIGRFVAGRSYQVADPECLRLLPPVIVDELADRIRELNTLDGTAAGN